MEGMYTTPCSQVLGVEWLCDHVEKGGRSHVFTPMTDMIDGSSHGGRNSLSRSAMSQDFGA